MRSFPCLEPAYCSMSSSNCCSLTYIQISQEAGQVVPSLCEFSTFCCDPHSHKGLGVVNNREVDVFLELSFSMIQRVLAIWSLVPLPFLNSAWTSGSTRFMYCWSFPRLENFEHYFTSMWDECNCAVFWAFFGIAFLWDWNENWPCPVLWPLLSFPNLLVLGIFSPGLGNDESERMTLGQSLARTDMFISAVKPFYRSRNKKLRVYGQQSSHGVKT